MDIATPLQALVNVIRSTGMSASVDGADVNVPGAWVALDDLGPASVAGSWQLRCTVYLIVADTDPTRAVEGLGALLTDLLTVLEPDGRVATQGVVLPADPTPLPGLAVPVHLYT